MCDVQGQEDKGQCRRHLSCPPAQPELTLAVPTAQCDERHPSCLNCIAHGVECPFKTGPRHPPPRGASHSPSSPASAAPPYADPARTLPEPDELALLQLELLHNFTTKTFATLTADPVLWEFWRDDMVQLGLSCDYIMRAVLAISALHLAYHRPDRRDFYTAQGILLHQKASRSAMRFMAADSSAPMDKDRAASLFLFATLTIFFALASPRRSNPDGTFFIGESGFPDWAFLVKGGKSIMDDLLGDQAGLETVAAPFLIYGRRRWEAQRAQLRRRSSEDASVLAPLRARIAAAAALSPDDDDDDDDDLLLLRDTYAHALDELEIALVAAAAAARQEDDQAAPRDVLDAMVWLWQVSDSLVPLLRAPARQEAVAIFAHFCVLLKHSESHWWLQGWADHLMARAHEVLDAEHREWIEWPMREMGWRGPGLGGAGSGL